MLSALAPDPPQRFAALRHAAAVAVGIAGLAYFLLATHNQSICHHETFVAVHLGARFSSGCGPPRLVDLVPFALAVGFLLWPDLTELGVGGILTLKRRVKVQEERQAGLETSVAELRQTIAQVSLLTQTQSVTAEHHTHLSVLPSAPPDQEALREAIVEKEPEIGQQPARPEADHVATEDAQELLGAFVQEYSRLEPFLLVPGTHRVAGGLEDLDEEQQDLVAWWNELFTRELDALRRTRNLLIHKPERVSPDTLKLALDNTRELSRILFDRLGETRDQDQEDEA